MAAVKSDNAVRDPLSRTGCAFVNTEQEA
jgi:hypothetical protein